VSPRCSPYDTSFRDWPPRVRERFTAPNCAAAERGPLRAGAARVDITPPVNPEYPPSGKYEHERLYVRAIVLDNGLARAALLNADIGNIARGCLDEREPADR